MNAAAAPARSWGFTLVAVAGVLWGTGGLAATFAAQHSALSWPALSAIRLVGGGALMLAVIAATGELRRLPRTPEALRHIGLTAVLSAVYQGAYFQAVALVGVAVATVVSLGAAPVAVALASAIRSRRMPRWPVLVALVAAVVGLIMVSDAPGQASDARNAVLGTLLALVAGLSFAATTVVNRRAIPGLSSAALIATSFTLAGLLVAIWGAFAGFDLASTDAAGWGWIAFLAIVPTVLAYLAFFGGLQRGVPSTTAAILSLIEPVTATLLAVTILREPLTLAASVGVVLLLFAVVLVRPRPGVVESYSATEIGTPAAED
ncbi:DMT family transporter [Gryllotalpicola koreensis]|uniref:EamA family transporter n=1 Tax=Gryllotalpicola koreensis TaxID=993086 RepID=A0ABP7ZQU9_9MICO